MIPYTLIHSRRKTIALHIRDGQLEVRAPLNVSKNEIERFIALKSNWITDKLRQSSTQLAQRETFELSYGSNVLYRSKLCPIEAKSGSQIGFDGSCFYMPLSLQPSEIKAACVKIYRLLAKQYIPERVRAIAAGMGVVPSRVSINGAKTRWGSCSSKKSLNFSWFLMMADDTVIDYVIIHELAHITQMNHSAKFWEVVAATMPDYNIQRAALKQLQQRLRTENWR
ncbi:MAG: M48 family metallopeptidase [Defluviitaleaceae bacterium]|nr:M48 family metallopeptidase [Defluviitaleaceae bacterium]